MNKKKRSREVNPITEQVFYREHWRHVQYDTDQQIAEDFFNSIDYQQYLADGGNPFSKDIFLQCKCFCIDKSDFQECTCPPCTLMRETLRGWHEQRTKWYRGHDATSATAYPCGSCGKGSAYREAFSSLSKLCAHSCMRRARSRAFRRSLSKVGLRAPRRSNSTAASAAVRRCLMMPAPIGRQVPRRKHSARSAPTVSSAVGRRGCRPTRSSTATSRTPSGRSIVRVWSPMAALTKMSSSRSKAHGSS